MKLFRSSLSTWIVVLLVVGGLAPSVIAKPLVFAGLLVAVLTLLNHKTLSAYVLPKLLIIWFFIPGVVMTYVDYPSQLARFFPLVFLALFFPYRDFNPDFRVLSIFLIASIFWLIATQILIAFNYGPLLSFRDVWYPIENNVWNYGYVESLIFTFGSFRAAGLYYNPNVFAMVLLLIFLMYFFSMARSNLKMSDPRFLTPSPTLVFVFITSIVGFSLYLTGSRTYLGIFLFFLVLQYSRQMWFGLKRLKFSLINVFVMVGSLGVVVLSVARFTEGFLAEEGSARIKQTILSDYVRDTDPFILLVGGQYSVQFDAEFGYWIGAAGFLGLAGLMLFYLLIGLTKRFLFPLIISLVLIGIGNSFLYGLLSATLAVAVLMIAVRRTERRPLLGAQRECYASRTNLVTRSGDPGIAES